MYPRWWIWPLVISVAATILITLNFFIDSAVWRVWILSVVAICGITAFTCLVSFKYLPLVTPRVSGFRAAPDDLDGEVCVTLAIRGPDEAKPSDKASKKAMKVRAQDAHEVACHVLTMTDHESGSIPQLLAERELMLTKFQHVELENSQLREKVEKLLPDLTRAVEKAGAVIRAAKPVAAVTSSTPERRPKKQPQVQQETSAPTTQQEPYASNSLQGAVSAKTGVCDWCGQKNRRRVYVYGTRRGRDGPDAKPRTVAVCRDSGGCALGLLADDNGSLTSPDADSGSTQSQVVPETAEAS